VKGPRKAADRVGWTRVAAATAIDGVKFCVGVCDNSRCYCHHRGCWDCIGTGDAGCRQVLQRGVDSGGGGGRRCGADAAAGYDGGDEVLPCSFSPPLPALVHTPPVCSFVSPLRLFVLPCSFIPPTLPSRLPALVRTTACARLYPPVRIPSPPHSFILPLHARSYPPHFPHACPHSFVPPPLLVYTPLFVPPRVFVSLGLSHFRSRSCHSVGWACSRLRGLV
jgi:hypothetical protein